MEFGDDIMAFDQPELEAETPDLNLRGLSNLDIDEDECVNSRERYRGDYGDALDDSRIDLRESSDGYVSSTIDSDVLLALQNQESLGQNNTGKHGPYVSQKPPPISMPALNIN